MRDPRVNPLRRKSSIANLKSSIQGVARAIIIKSGDSYEEGRSAGSKG